MYKTTFMKYLFFFLSAVFFLTTSVAAQQSDSLVMQAAIKKLMSARQYTLDVAEGMPENKYDYKPVPDEMSFGAQLLHLADNLGWLSSAYLSTGNNPVTGADKKLTKKAEIKAVVEKAYDYALTALRNFDPARLADTVSFFAGLLTKLQILTLINDHQTHHRAQLLVYLRLNGIKPPKYVGW